LACCAFAVLLVSQLLLPLRWVARYFLGEVSNKAVSWSPEFNAEPRKVLTQRKWRRGFAIIVAAEIVLFGGVAVAADTAFSQRHSQGGVFEQMHAVICSVVRP
jgi:hypothetical protein